MLRSLRLHRDHIKASVRPRHSQIRLQHENGHKWYFQDQNANLLSSTASAPSQGQHSPRSHAIRRSLVWATLFGITGWFVGHIISRASLKIMVDPFPEPGSPEEAKEMETIIAEFEKLPTAQALRGDPDWKEWDAYSNFSPEERKHRLTSGPLGGLRGLALQVGIRQAL